MSTAQAKKIDKALELPSLRLPSNPRVVGIDWEPVEDSSGEESLELYVLFEDRATDLELQSAPINEIKKRIMDRLAK